MLNICWIYDFPSCLFLTPSPQTRFDPCYMSKLVFLVKQEVGPFHYGFSRGCSDHVAERRLSELPFEVRVLLLTGNDTGRCHLPLVIFLIGYFSACS